MTLIALIVMAAIFACFVMVLGTMESALVFRAVIPTKMIQLLFYVFFVLMLVSSTISAIGNVYNANNMDLFLSVPLSNLRLYFSKLLEILFETTIMLVVFGLPVILAYCYSLEPKSGFVLTAIAVSLPVVIIPAGLSMAFATIFVKLASHIWKRGAFLLVSLVIIFLWGVNELLKLLGQVEINRSGGEVILQMVSLFENPNPYWMPSRWASDLVTYFVGSPLIAAQEKILLLILSALGSVALGFIFFDLFSLKVRSTANTHAKVENSRSNTKQKTDFVRRLLEAIYVPLPLDAHTRAIILKDLSSLTRDRAQALQLLMYAGIALVYIVVFRFMSSALNLAREATLAWGAFLASVNIMFAGFILTAVMTRLVYPSISLEGKALWVLLVTPVKILKLISAKFWCWIPLTITVSFALLLAGILAIGSGWPVLMTTLIIGASLSIGCTGLAIGIGSVFATFEWESPNQISTGLGTLVLLLLSLGLVLVTSGPASVLNFLMILPKLRVIVGHGLSFAIMSASLFIIIFMNLSIAHFACKIGARSLAHKVTN